MKKLSDIKENDKVFKVPENYFDEFQNRMSELTDSKNLQKSKLSRLPYLLKPAVLGPLIVILLIASYLLISQQQTEHSETLADISTIDLLDFLEEEGVSEEELLSFMDNSVDEFEINTFPEGGLLENFDNQELEDISNDIELLNDYL